MKTGLITLATLALLTMGGNAGAGQSNSTWYLNQCAREAYTDLARSKGVAPSEAALTAVVKRDCRRDAEAWGREHHMPEGVADAIASAVAQAPAIGH